MALLEKGCSYFPGLDRRHEEGMNCLSIANVRYGTFTQRFLRKKPDQRMCIEKNG